MNEMSARILSSLFEMLKYLLKSIHSYLTMKLNYATSYSYAFTLLNTHIIRYCVKIYNLIYIRRPKRRGTNKLQLQRTRSSFYLCVPNIIYNFKKNLKLLYNFKS